MKVPEYRPRGIPGVYILTDLPLLPLSAYATIPWILRTRDEVLPATTCADERTLRQGSRRGPQVGRKGFYRAHTSADCRGEFLGR